MSDADKVNESRLKLDATKRREICAILTTGGTRAMAAAYVGCVPETIRSTARKLPEFAEELRRAEVKPELAFLKSIRVAAADVKQWRAAAWGLEHEFPERYAARSAGSISLKGVNDIVKALAEIIVAEVPVKRYRRQILDRLARLIGEKRAGR